MTDEGFKKKIINCLLIIHPGTMMAKIKLYGDLNQYRKRVLLIVINWFRFRKKFFFFVELIVLIFFFIFEIILKIFEFGDEFF